MRFPQSLHWNEGLFLQPHHFQYFDWQASEFRRLDRRLSHTYPFGLIDFEVDLEALSSSTFTLRRFSAVMGDGQELSMPGNCVLRPLSLEAVLKQNPPDLTIFVAVPQWSAFEGNVADDADRQGNVHLQKKLWVTDSKSRRDENQGDNEIVMVTRGINARFVTNLDDVKDMAVLPVAHLRTVMHEGTQAKVTLDTAFVPPFLLLGADSPLFGVLSALLADVRRCRDKHLNGLNITAFRPEHFTGTAAHALLVYKTLNYYEMRLSAILAAPVDTFAVYLELRSFLADLMGLFPFHSIREILPYNHLDSGPVFAETVSGIRSFIASEGGAAYIRYPFVRTEKEFGHFLEAEVSAGASFDEAYIAVQCGTNELDLIAALERGDKFKVTGGESVKARTRGIRLAAVRYPPRVLPVITGAIWFKLDTDGAPKIWQEIREGKNAVIDYTAEMFPDLEAALFITVADKKEGN